LSYLRSSLFTCAGLLLPWPDLLGRGVDYLCFEELVVWKSSSSPEHLCLPGQCPWDTDKQIPEQAEICPPEVQGSGSAMSSSV